MADDQGPKISSIDELVNELTKKNPGPSPAPAARPTPSSPSQGPSVSPQVPKPKFTAPPPPPPMPRPTPSVGSGPSVAPAPRPAPAPMASAPAAPKTPVVPAREYQSSIRTMKEDISTLKQGQKPAGVDVPRKIETIIPTTPSVPKPAVPGQAPQFKMPSANLGQAEKTAPLPQAKSPSVPSATIPSQKPQIYIPPAPSSSDGAEASGDNSRLFMFIAGGAVLVALFYWVLMLRSEPEIVLETPTPTPVPTQIVINLSDIFPVPAYAVTLQEDKYAESLKAGVNAMTVEGGTFKIINAEDVQGRDILWTEYVTVPRQVQDSLGGEMMVLAYGQKEIFSQNGQLNPNAQTEERLAIIIEAKDSSFAGQGLGTWEPTMVADLQQLFTLNPTKQASSTFLLTNHQGANVKYKNFPNPDRSIDYGVVNASNGKNYIVITNSRESMFTVLDVLMGTKKLYPLSSPSPSPSVSP